MLSLKDFTEDQAVTKDHYLIVMRRLREQVHRKRLDLWKEVFGIYTMTTHLSLAWERISGNKPNKYLPYSLDMGQAYLFFVSKLKFPLSVDVQKTRWRIYGESSRRFLKIHLKNVLTD